MKKNRREDAELEYVASVNLGDDPMWESLKKLEGNGVTVMGLQEGLDRWDSLVRRWLKERPTWAVSVDLDVAAATAVPIIWDTRHWRTGHGRSILAAGRRWVGAKGAGPTYMHPKVVTVQVLIHRATGQRVRFLNLHLPPSYTRTDLPAAERRARVILAELMLAEVERVVRASHIPCVVLMDANGTEREAPFVYRRLKAVGLTGFTQGATKDRRAIDHAATTMPWLLATTQIVELATTASDHKAVVRPLRLRPALQRVRARARHLVRQKARRR